MKKILLVVTLAALATPALANAGSFSGVVVGKSHGSLAVAAPSGLVRTVSTSVRARVGARVVVSAARVRVVGLAHSARIRGAIVGRSRGRDFLAAGRTILAIRTTRGLAAVGSGPAPGTVVQDTVGINAQGTLTQQSSQPVGQASTVQVQATVTAVGNGTITLSVNGQTLTLPLPSGLSLPASIVNTTVALTLNLGNGGATAAPEQGDDNEQGDDDNEQGDDDQGSSASAGGSVTGQAGSGGEHSGGDDGGGDD